MVRVGRGGLGALATILHGTVNNALAEGLDYGNGFAHLGAQDDFGDGPERILDSFGRRPGGIVEGEGEVVVGVHFHLSRCYEAVCTDTREMAKRRTTYVIRHLAHQLACDLVEDSLQVCLATMVTCGFEMVNALGQVLWQGHVGEDLEVLGVQETQTSLALDPP